MSGLRSPPLRVRLVVVGWRLDEALETRQHAEARDALVADHVFQVLQLLLTLVLRRGWTFWASAGRIGSLGPAVITISRKYVGAKDSP